MQNVKRKDSKNIEPSLKLIFFLTFVLVLIFVFAITFTFFVMVLVVFAIFMVMFTFHHFQSPAEKMLTIAFLYMLPVQRGVDN